MNKDKHFTQDLENQIKNDKIVKSLKFLVERYKNDLEKLKISDTYNEDSKIQTVSVLREVIQDLELILEMK